MANQLFGKIQGLAPAQSKALLALYDRSVAAEDFLTRPLARSLTEISRELNRRIGVLINRRGDIDKVIVGDAQRVFIPDLGARRAGEGRLRGVRLVHTSLRGEGLTEDDLTDLSLLRLDAVLTVRVLDDGLPGPVQYAALLPPEPSGAMWRVSDAESVEALPADWGLFIADLETQFARSPRLQEIAGAEGAILVGITLRNPRKARRSLAELERLADTAGLRVVDSVLHRRDKLDGKTCVGQGTLQTLLLQSMHQGAEVLLFDRELSPSQLRNIATVTELKVLDRTQLILDIFAQHAQSREGKLQVELAQLRYAMPRLALMPTAMSRLTGGIGGRGPGETKLEINRRRADERVLRVERELGQLAKHRALRRSRRIRMGLPQVSIVGYTNAGKSTLLNRLTRSEVLAADALFATLDPTSRRFRFPAAREIILTDTVGFIEDLPKTLVQAFRATLEELDEANLMLHVMDASDIEREHHKASVEGVLKDLGLEETPVVLVWNKADRVAPEELEAILRTYGGVAVSALTGEGTQALLDHIERTLFLQARAESDEAAPTL
ncbi:MAG: GTPase HflX [Deltaproteobacteria bacterium]|nr:GTPase HflX [Deltaproteobacteria bacterium]